VGFVVNKVDYFGVFPSSHRSVNVLYTSASVPEVCDRCDQPECYQNVGPQLGLTKLKCGFKLLFIRLFYNVVSVMEIVENRMSLNKGY
jgi:hypothetical protein